MTMPVQPTRARLLAFTGLLLIAGLIAAACSVSNDDIETDEFFRPPGPAATAASADDDSAQAQAQAQAQTEDDGDSREDSAAQAQSDDEPQAQSSDAPAATADDDDELELAEDIVRRYRNPAYGYSLDLVCGPFCDVTPGGIDRVGFTSETDPTAINVTARAAPDGATLDDLQVIWQAETIGTRTPNILARQEVSLASDGTTPALIIDWNVDQRATGGTIERWRSLIAQVGPIAYFVNAGAIEEVFADLEPVLQQSLDSFLALPTPDSLPGAYTRFGFAVLYDVSGFIGELPLSGVANQPTADGGRLFAQDDEGILLYILTWESLSQAIYDADTAIDAESQPPGAVSVTEDLREDFELSAGIIGRVGAFTAADAGGNNISLRVFSWYCEEGGRSFTLQSLSAEERPAVLDGFRCLDAS